MDEEVKQLLREDLGIAKENNKLLTKLVWHQKWSSWFNVIKWIIVVGSAIGALYYLQPVMENLLNTYSEFLGTFSETSIRALPGQ